MPPKRPVGKSALARKELDQATRLNTVFNLRTKKKLSLRKIAEKTGVSHEQVRLDLKQLQKSVQSPQTIKKLSGPSMKKTPVEQANFLNQVFNLRKQGYSINEIAKKMNVSESPVRKSLETLSKSVESQETKQVLRKVIRIEKAQRQNKVFDLKAQGFTVKEIALKLNANERQVRKILETLSESAESPRTKKWLREGIRIEKAQRQNQVFNLRRQGYTINEIAAKLKTSRSQKSKESLKPCQNQ